MQDGLLVDETLQLEDLSERAAHPVEARLVQANRRALMTVLHFVHTLLHQLRNVRLVASTFLITNTLDNIVLCTKYCIENPVSRILY